MKLKHFFTLLVVVLAGQANANNYRNMEPLTLDVPELKFEVTNQPEQVSNNLEVTYPSASPKMDVDFFKSKTNPGVKPYKFLDDMTFVGVPLFFAGWALKSDKAMFRVNAKAEQGGKKNTQLLTDFKTGIDDYTQFFGPAMVVGLKLGGYEGRSDWPRLLASAGMSYGIMALLVNTIKYSAKEMRPDGSTANSWPSGHTATAFVGATLLHKEYGLTRSPWWSVAGYGVATATGVMRVLNNRHLVSDVMSGAGLGILAGELGYALGDVFFKGKGLLRNDLQMDFDNPSFFGISMGVGLGNKDLEFESQGQTANIKFRAATVVDAEGAYFFNKYIGVGGRLRVRAQSVKDFGTFAEQVSAEDYYAWEGMQEIYKNYYPGYNEATYWKEVGYNTDSEDAWNANSPVTDINGTVKSDHITEFTGSVGVYLNLPLSKHFSLGTKALIGRSITQELDIDGHAEGNMKDISYKLTIDNSQKDAFGDPTIKLDGLQYPQNTGEKWTDDWEYLTIGAKSSTSFGTGLSLTYRYKSNFSWRLFCDYDYTRKDYTATYDPYHFVQKGMTPGSSLLMDAALMAADGEYTDGMGLDARQYQTRKKMNYWTIGLSFLVNL
jgi:membrane-associated phospholipid phosphatase